jgi:flavin reductase (DIM6/NTAB) family NADH-FMN oxidoreductase RutF
LLNKFKVPDWKHKFDTIEYELSPSGNPVLKGALGYLDCVVERAIDTGDHTLFIGRVTGGALKNEGDALTTIQYPGRYRGDK